MSAKRIAQHLNGLSEPQAREALSRCCGAARWVEAMLAGRPFRDDRAVYHLAERVWWELGPDDWREAFAQHPRIGERPQDDAATRDWSRREQAGMDDASHCVRQEIAELNRTYEDRFGHVFLICATGLSGDDMLRALRARLGNDPEDELSIAAGQQAKITRLRLEKLVTT